MDFSREFVWQEVAVFKMRTQKKQKLLLLRDEGVKHVQRASCSQSYYFNYKAALWSEWTSLQCICFWWLLIGVWKPTKFFCHTFPTNVNLTNVYLVRFQISQLFYFIFFPLRFYLAKIHNKSECWRNSNKKKAKTVTSKMSSLKCPSNDGRVITGFWSVRSVVTFRTCWPGWGFSQAPSFQE